MWKAANPPTTTPMLPAAYITYSSHFLRDSKAMAAMAIATCKTVVACAQR